MSIFLTLLGLLPAILQAVVAVEQAFGKKATAAAGVPAVSGATKKQIVLTPVLTAAKTITGAPVTPALATAVSTLIDTTVASLNSVGLLGTPATGVKAPAADVKAPAAAVKK